MDFLGSAVEACHSFLSRIHTVGLSRFEHPIDPVELLGVLASQKEPVKLYWKNRLNDEEVAALGVAHRLSDISSDDIPAETIRTHLESAPNARFWGGFRFDPTHPPDDIWAPYGKGLLFLPLFEWIKSDEGVRFAVNVWIEDLSTLHQQIEEIHHALIALQPPMTHDVSDYSCIERRDTPDQTKWIEDIDTILHTIDSSPLEKVVMSRQTQFRFAHHLNPFDMVDKLRLVDPHSNIFLLQLSPDSAFIGGTPERLFLRHNNTLYSEALAGTVPRGQTERLDRELETILRESDTCIQEHTLVVNMLRDQLKTLCHSLHFPSDLHIKKLPLIQHLLVECEGQLHPHVHDTHLLQHLHPTPAVAGTPTELAYSMIQELESYDRGWYAGPIGYCGLEKSEFVVAIRSGLVQKDTVLLFSGAGIVAGAQPEKEWAEIESKIGLFKQLFVDA